MEATVDHPLPWLRYVDANEIDGDEVNFDGMNVESPTGENLGSIEGFVIDSRSARPYYVVVDAGGWFKSKHFLLPVGHARLNSDTDLDTLVADVPRDRIDRFPGFDKDEFEKLTPEALKRFNDETCTACNVTTISFLPDEPYHKAWDRSNYKYPDWWTAEPTSPERMGANAFKEMVDYPPVAPAEKDIASIRNPERVVARDTPDSDSSVRETGEPSPHFGGRAQPGDVLGIETGGESTSIGDTSEDENDRRRAALKNAPKP
jgi:hypothetical protein